MILGFEVTLYLCVEKSNIKVWAILQVENLVLTLLAHSIAIAINKKVWGYQIKIVSAILLIKFAEFIQIAWDVKNIWFSFKLKPIKDLSI